MVKLTQVLFEIKDETQARIERISNAYQQALADYDNEMIKYETNPYGEAPEMPKQPKTIKLKDEDYIKTNVELYIKESEVAYITQSLEKDTILVTKTGKEITVIGTPEEISNLIKN